MEVIDMNNIEHNKTKVCRELYAMLILEKLLNFPLYKGESPDLFNENKEVGIELVRAYNKKYEKWCGDVIKDSSVGAYVERGTARDLTRVKEEICKKMFKLCKYKKYKFNYLFIETDLFTEYYTDLCYDARVVFENLKQDILFRCSKSNKDYNCFDKIIIDCVDGILILDWVTNDFTVNQNISRRPNGVYDNKSIIDTLNDLWDKYNGDIDRIVDNTPVKMEESNNDNHRA